MNKIAKAIAHAFCCEECRRCDDCSDNKKCWRLSDANRLYVTHIKPLEDALAKAEADKSALVEALEEMVSVAEIIVGFANIPANANGPLIKSRAVLSRMKEQS